MTQIVAQRSWSRAFANDGPRSARSAYYATLVILAAGAVMFVALVAVSIAMAKFAPFIAVVALVAIFGVPQAAAAMALGSRRTWLRVIGIVVALAIALVAALFVGAIVLQAFLMIAGTFKGSFGDVYDTIGVFASLVAAAPLLFFDGRAVWFGIRELLEQRSG
jgi:hypothetical protein